MHRLRGRHAARRRLGLQPPSVRAEEQRGRPGQGHTVRSRSGARRNCARCGRRIRVVARGGLRPLLLALGKEIIDGIGVSPAFGSLPGEREMHVF